MLRNFSLAVLLWVCGVSLPAHADYLRIDGSGFSVRIGTPSFRTPSYRGYYAPSPNYYHRPNYRYSPSPRYAPNSGNTIIVPPGATVIVPPGTRIIQRYDSNFYQPFHQPNYRGSYRVYRQF